MGQPLGAMSQGVTSSLTNPEQQLQAIEIYGLSPVRNKRKQDLEGMY